MIQIPVYPEPNDFNAKVRVRGNAFLATTPHPTNSQWRSKEFWRHCHDQLYKLCGGICAYCASWTSRRSTTRLGDNTSVDHFLPKSHCPELAYEWSNFRLCRSKLNERKDDSLSIIDPCAINSNWFQIDFFTFRVGSNPSAPLYVRSRVDSSIAQLGLNDTGYIKERMAVVKQYCVHGIPLSRLEKHYPFIAREMRRTDFDNTLKATLSRAFGRSNLRN